MTKKKNKGQDGYHRLCLLYCFLCAANKTAKRLLAVCRICAGKQFNPFYTVFLNRPEAMICVSALCEK